MKKLKSFSQVRVEDIAKLPLDDVHKQRLIDLKYEMQRIRKLMHKNEGDQFKLILDGVSGMDKAKEGLFKED